MKSTHPRILFIINGLGYPRQEVISGGDKRALEIAKGLSQTCTIGVLGTPIVKQIFRRQGLEAVYYELDIRLPNQIRNSTIASYIVEILLSVAVVPRLPYWDVVYSTSDFLVDTIPALLFKVAHRPAEWVAMVHHLIPIAGISRSSRVVSLVSQRLSFFLLRASNRVLVYETPEGRRIKKLLRALGVREISEVQNGVNLQEISEIPAQKIIYDCCCVASLRPSKGLVTLVNIWKEVCRERPDSLLLIVGGGSMSYSDLLRSEIERLGLSTNVWLSGPILGYRLFELMKSSKVFASTSLEEGWGIAVCEAMACGLPVVAFDLPAFHAFGSAINRVAQGNTEAFASEVLALLSDEGYRISRAKIAVETARRFDWKVISQHELELLQNSHPR